MSTEPAVPVPALPQKRVLDTAKKNVAKPASKPKKPKISLNALDLMGGGASSFRASPLVKSGPVTVSVFKKPTLEELNGAAGGVGVGREVEKR
jgi:hypothetical protein